MPFIPPANTILPLEKSEKMASWGPFVRSQCCECALGVTSEHSSSVNAPRRAWARMAFDNSILNENLMMPPNCVLLRKYEELDAFAAYSHVHRIFGRYSMPSSLDRESG